jgi:hypothetical protein
VRCDFYFSKGVGRKYLNGTSNDSFENDRFLGWVVVGMGMKVFVSVYLFSIDSVGEVIVRLIRISIKGREISFCISIMN